MWNAQTILWNVSGMPHRRLRTGRDPCGEHKPEETGHCSNQDDVATSSRCGAIVEIPSPVDSHGSSRNSTLCCWISLLEHTTSCNRFWRRATGRRVGRRMGTPVRTFQMGDTSTLGWSALRSYKCRHWQDQVEGIARLDITCVTHRMLQVVPRQEQPSTYLQPAKSCSDRTHRTGYSF